MHFSINKVRSDFSAKLSGIVLTNKILDIV
jgi:hypothetical protein